MRASLSSLIVLLAACASSAPPPAAPPPAPAAPGPGPRVQTTGVVGTPESEPPVAPPSAEAVAAAREITAELMHGHIAFLASDELRGRATPSLGLELAAQHVAQTFESLGLEPAGENGGYIQRWTFRAAEIDYSRVALEARTSSDTAAGAFGSDYFILPAVRDSVQAPIAWAGIAAPDMRSLAPGEAAGRIVAYALPGERPGPGWQLTLQAAINSAALGAPAGILFVLDPGFGRSDVAEIAASAGSTSPLPVHIAGVRWETARELFRLGSADLDSLRVRTDSVLVPLPDVQIVMRPARRSTDSRPPNVAALLRGSDPVLRDTYVVYSAHIDHLGMGQPDPSRDSIFNGADDNASGTAGVLAVARAFAALETPPARSILFLGVSGEEEGLYGSEHFVTNPTVPLHQMVANLNIDMIGRNPGGYVAGIGMEYSTLGPLARDAARASPDLDLRVVDDPWPSERLFFRSDHYNFARRGVPALFLTSGPHADYHRVSDSVEKIDTARAARIARLLFHIGYLVATAPERPEWTERGRREVLGTVGGGGDR